MYQDPLIPTSGERLQPVDPPALDAPRWRNGEGSHLGRSLPGAVAGALLVSAIAFGAIAVHTPDGSGDAAAYAGRQPNAHRAGGNATGYHNEDDVLVVPPSAEPSDGSDATKEPAAEPTKEATPAPTEKPKATATPKPVSKPAPTEKPAPTATPKPEPVPTSQPLMGLALWNGDGYVKVHWSACAGDFDYYKVVRSTDSTVKWPLGAYDTLVGAVSPGTTTMLDKYAPADRTLWYRVFCVRKTSEGYKILNSTAARSIHTPAAPTPTVAPQTMGLVLALGESGVLVDWTKCESDRFDYYKVVRSTDSTVKWPLGAYDSLVFATGDRYTTSFVDTEADPGKTYYYRVFCLDSTSSGYVTLNSTTAHGIHVPATEPDPTPTPAD
jgi:hypothetical protein